MPQTKKDLCILHIGMPKTGSTTIQENLFHHIMDPRVTYGRHPHSNHGDLIVKMFADFPEDHPTGRMYKEFEDYLDDKYLLEEGFVDPVGSIQIISGEDLFHLPDYLGNGSRLLELRKYFEKFFLEIIVVAYVRKPSELLASAFQQLVKYHELGSLNPDFIYHKYRNLQAYIDIFGKDKVLLWNFLPEKFTGGDLLSDFTSRLHIKQQRSSFPAANESLSQEAISILFTYHFHSNVKKLTKNIRPIAEAKLVELLRPFGSNRFRLSGQYIRDALNRNQEDYSWIVAKMGDDFLETEETLNAPGFDNEMQLMMYATQFIPHLIDLAGGKDDKLVIDDTPQTVARLVEVIVERIAAESLFL